LEEELNHEIHEIHKKKSWFCVIRVFRGFQEIEKKKVAFPQRTWHIDLVARVKDNWRKADE
jgi:hypothetical protein